MTIRDIKWAIDYRNNANDIAVKDGFAQLDTAHQVLAKAAKILVDIMEDDFAAIVDLTPNDDMIAAAKKELADPSYEDEKTRIAFMFIAMAREAEKYWNLPDSDGEDECCPPGYTPTSPFP